MFTSLIMMQLVSLIGLINIILEIIDKEYISALRYLITSIALCMGYIAFI